MTTVDRGAGSGLVDDTALVTAMLDTEVALVQAQADVGVVPRAAADAILVADLPLFGSSVATGVRGLPPVALVLFESMVGEDELSSGGWVAEWQPLRETLRIAAGTTADAADGLAVALAEFDPSGHATISGLLAKPA